MCKLMGNDILQHLAQCLAHSQAQLMAPLISITYLGHLCPHCTTQKTEGRQEGNKEGSPALEGKLNKETGDVGSSPSSA